MSAKAPFLLIFGIGAAFAAALVLFASTYTVDPTEQVIVTQFGKPQGDPTTEAGLHFKMPFVQDIHRIPKQILEWDGLRTNMPTRDKLYISVDTFGRWRIVRPLEYFTKLRDERSALSRLEDILGSETRNAVAKHDLIELIRTDKDRTPIQDDTLTEIADATAGKLGVLPPIQKGRHNIEAEIKEAALTKLAEFGIELLDVRIKRINYNPSVVSKIYERMISERAQIASRFRSEGEGEAAKKTGEKERDLSEIESEAYKQQQTIQGEADAKATEIYAAAYGQNPKAAEFYEFLKTMETYKAVIGKDTTLLLSTESDLFRFLRSATGEREGSKNVPEAPKDEAPREIFTPPLDDAP
jgi:membrane protease subunit HflC